MDGLTNRIDAAIDAARAEREVLRWILLSALWHGRPYGLLELVLLQTARDIPLNATADQVRAELMSLAKRGLVTVNREGPLWSAELTAEGEAVVDHRAPCPNDIARPKRF